MIFLLPNLKDKLNNKPTLLKINLQPKWKLKLGKSSMRIRNWKSKVKEKMISLNSFKKKINYLNKEFQLKINKNKF